MARETFGVHNVVARIYDPKRAEVYQRLGIPTVATVRWTADQMIRRLFPDGVQALWRDPTGVVDLVEVHVDDGWFGRTVRDLEAASGARVAFLSRIGESIIPTADTVLQEGDLVHVMLREDEADHVTAVLGQKPEVHVMRVAIAGAGNVGRSIAAELLEQQPRGAARRQGRRARSRPTACPTPSGCSPTRARWPRSRRPGSSAATW